MRPPQAFGFHILRLADKELWMRLKGTKLNLAPERALFGALYIVTSISRPVFNAFRTLFSTPSAISPPLRNVENEESGVVDPESPRRILLDIAPCR